MKVVKRSGEEVKFDENKIFNAIMHANATVAPENQLSQEQIGENVKNIVEACKKITRSVTVEEIQDMVENELMRCNAFDVARKYITYRYDKTLLRKANSTDEQLLSLINMSNEEIKQENSNKNPILVSTQRDYMAGEVSKDLTKRFLLTKDLVDAHNEGMIHIHDMDYFVGHIHNCDLVNLEDMLQNGTIISGTRIDTPHSFHTACNIATQIMAQVASSQYGGQSISLAHLAPFVNVSREVFKQSIEKEFEGVDVPNIAEIKEKALNQRVYEEIKQGVQTIQYQINTLQTTNGQAPFVSIFMYLNEAKNQQEKDDLALIIQEVLKQRIKGTKNESGAWITPAFPKLLYVLEEDNINPGTKYYYLTELAAECTAKRMVPDYISEKIMKEYKIDQNGDGQCYACMGCRSFLTPYVDENKKPKYYGRFNQGVVTVNLVDAALSSAKDEQAFWSILDDRAELCHRALQIRHSRLVGTPSDVAPILWQNGAIARLKKGETIDKLLYNGYSTISLGYAGLWETVYYMTGEKLTSEKGKAFGLAIMKKLNEYTKKWKADEHMDYSLYGTPIEMTTYKFAKNLQRRFGIIPGVTDKNYITNSYHIHVTEQIDAFDKLKIESEFQRLSPGGAISYVEVPDMKNNIPAVLTIIKYIYDNIMYAELNTKSDFCQVCGYDGEIQIVEDEDGKLVWECPNCHNRDQSKMNVARRTCGYIGTQFWNQGRTQEIKERALHL